MAKPTTRCLKREPFDGTYCANVPDGEYKIQLIAGHLTGHSYNMTQKTIPLWADTAWEDGSVIEVEENQTYDLGTAILTDHRHRYRCPGLDGFR